MFINYLYKSNHSKKMYFQGITNRYIQQITNIISYFWEPYQRKANMIYASTKINLYATYGHTTEINVRKYFYTHNISCI